MTKQNDYGTAVVIIYGYRGTGNNDSLINRPLWSEEFVASLNTDRCADKELKELKKEALRRHEKDDITDQIAVVHQVAFMP